MYIMLSKKIFLLKNKTSAFTLAEVLITLGVIGIIATMTVPTLMNTYQKIQTVTQLKKNFTYLAQAVKLSEIDNGPNSDWDVGTPGDSTSLKNRFDIYWAPYLKIIKYCSSYSDCGYKTYNIYTRIDGTTVAYSASNMTTVILPDGTILIVRHIDDTDRIVFVDINGSSAPNKYGRDVFVFLYNANGFVPDGYGASRTSINNNCNYSDQGQFCAAKMMLDGWTIADDYPW